MTRCFGALLVGMLLPVVARAQMLVGEGKVFVRLTNVRPDNGPILIRVHVVPNHDQPFGWDGKTIYVGARGENGDAAVPKDQWLVPGQSTNWIDIGRFMNRQGERSSDTYLSPVLLGVMSEPAGGLHLVAEVATGPGIGVVRRIEVHKPELQPGQRNYPWEIGFGVWNHGPELPTLGLLIPSRLDRYVRIYTLEEALRAQLELITALPKYGRQPEKFIFVTRAHPEVFKALGYTGYPPNVVEGNLGDEIGLEVGIKPEEQDRRFRELMKAKRVSPLELISENDRPKVQSLPEDQQWQQVHVVPPLPAVPKQYYESAIFRYGLWYEELAARTRKIEAANPGKRTVVGANYSPHMNVWPDVRQWIDPFRVNAMTMSWTEDWWWQLPEVTPQGYGFLLDALRLAGTYHGAPIQFYVMPFRGSSPDNFRRMNSLAMAHGVKIFNHFVTQDQTLVTWDYIDWSDSPPMFQAIHDTIRDAGAVERRFYPAMPRSAQVAIVLSRAADTWDTEDLGGAGHLYGARFNANNDERKGLWLALRHAQLPVDLITDADIADSEGRKLVPYKVVYIVGAEMLAGAAAPLARWVHEGGSLYATGGGGLLDEYHRPQTGLLEMYGITGHELVRKDRGLRPRKDLSKPEKVLDQLTVRGIEGVERDLQLPALLYRETLRTTSSATTVGAYVKDRATGAVLHRYGKGQTLYTGALAGLAYLKPAVSDSHAVLPANFSASIRDFLTAPVRWAGVVAPIETSDPLVEAQLMEGPNGAGVVLINWRERPIADLVVRFPGLKNLKSVRSLRAAGYFKGPLDEQDSGRIPLSTDRDSPAVHVHLDINDYLLVD